MMLMKFNGGLGGLGDINTPCSSLSPESMAVGDSCTLPDGSNIAVYNGQRLVNPAGLPLDAINASALVSSGNWNTSQVSGTSGSGSGGGSNGSSWWSTALQSLVAGAAQGVTTGQHPAMPTTPIVATPWYQTPVGIIGIALGVLGLGFLAFKK